MMNLGRWLMVVPILAGAAVCPDARADSFNDTYTGTLSTRIDSDVKMVFSTNGTVKLQILEEWACKNVIGPGDLTWYYFPGVTLQGSYNYNSSTRELILQVAWDGNVRANNDSKITLDVVAAEDRSLAGSANRHRISGGIAMGGILCEGGDCYVAGGFSASLDVTNGDPPPPTSTFPPTRTSTPTRTFTPTRSPTATETPVPTPTPAEPDWNGDGRIDQEDLLFFFPQFHTQDALQPCDLTGDGKTNQEDLFLFSGWWGFPDPEGR